MLTKGVSNATVDRWTAFWLMSLTASGSFLATDFCTSLDQPALSFFYLCWQPVEYWEGCLPVLPHHSFFSDFGVSRRVIYFAHFGILRLVARREVLPVTIAILIVLAPIFGLAWKQLTMKMQIR